MFSGFKRYSEQFIFSMLGSNRSEEGFRHAQLFLPSKSDIITVSLTQDGNKVRHEWLQTNRILSGF